MTRRGFLGFLGGTICGTVVGQKAFGQFPEALTRPALDPRSGDAWREGAFLERDEQKAFESIAHEILRALDKRLTTKDRWNAVEEWAIDPGAIRLGDTLNIRYDGPFNPVPFWDLKGGQAAISGFYQPVVLAQNTGVWFPYCTYDIAHMPRMQYFAQHLEAQVDTFAKLLDEAADGGMLVTAPPELPLGCHAAVGVSGFGLSVRLVSLYDIIANRMVMRMDSLCGSAKNGLG